MDEATVNFFHLLPVNITLYLIHSTLSEVCAEETSLLVPLRFLLQQYLSTSSTRTNSSLAPSFGAEKYYPHLTDKRRDCVTFSVQ